MRHYKELAESYFEVSRNLQKSCIEHIKGILNNVEGKKLSWDYDTLDEYGLDPISMGYDGGNHPEYASNMFSNVEGVRLSDNDDIIINLEDGEMYIDYIYNVVELYDLCDFLDCFVASMNGENE